MKHITKLIKDIIPVILGILIALFINNWNEDRKDKKYLDQIFSSIDKELEETVADIKNVIPKQMAAIDSIDVYMDNDQFSIYDIVVRADGIHSPTIKTTAWNALSNSRVELIEYEKLSALAGIQESKENLILRNEKHMDFIFEHFDATSRQKKMVLKMIMFDIVNAEKWLQSYIEHALEKK